MNRCKNCIYYKKLGSNIHYCINSYCYRKYGFEAVAPIPLICFRKKVKDPEEKVYRCDPDKNTECLKTGCYRKNGFCKSTSHKEFRMSIFKRFKEWMGKRYG